MFQVPRNSPMVRIPLQIFVFAPEEKHQEYVVDRDEMLEVCQGSDALRQCCIRRVV